MSDVEHSHASVVVVQPIKPFAVSPKEAAVMENSAVSVIYERLNRGEYDAVKDGHRTKILVASIERRQASLPAYGANKSSMPPPPPYERRRRKSRKAKVDRKSRKVG